MIQFPPTLPTDAIAILQAQYEGVPQTPHDLDVAVYNLDGYARGLKYLPIPPTPTPTPAPLSNAAKAHALHDLVAAHKVGDGRTGVSLPTLPDWLVADLKKIATDGLQWLIDQVQAV